ncbi:MAG: radical SAM protein, partial [Candidatus Sericytochromatia bacterium]
MKERIRKSYETLNKLADGYSVSISYEFLELKLKEITLEYEFQVKKQEEKEEMRAIQEELREEEKARREFEQAQKQAEKEEETYQRALLKARKEVEKATGELQEELNYKILILEQELLLAQEKKFQWYARFRAEMDEKIIAKLAKSGLMTAAMGVESFSQDTLDKMNKKKEEDFILSTVYALINNGVKASINLLVGYPEETKENFITTLKVTDKLFDRFRDENKDHLFKMTIRNFELRPFSTTYNYFSKFGIEAHTWENKYNKDYFSEEFENIFKKTLCNFKVINVPIDETINRLALLNQVKNKDSFIINKNRMSVSVMDTYNHFDE